MRLHWQRRARETVPFSLSPGSLKTLRFHIQRGKKEKKEKRMKLLAAGDAGVSAGKVSDGTGKTEDGEVI